MSRGWVEQASSIALATLVALMLWFVSSEDIDPIETVHRFPTVGAIAIEVRDVPEGTAYYDPSAREGRVALRGLTSGIELMEPEDIVLYVDLNAVETGAVTATLPVEWDCGSCIRRGVRVTAAEPAEVTLHLGAEASQQRVVEVEVLTAPPPGYVVMTTQPDPAQVTLRAAAPQLSRVARVVAEVSDLEGARADVTIEHVPLLAVDRDAETVSDVQIEPSMVDVLLGVRRRGIEVSVTPGVEGLQADGYYVSSIAVEPQIVQLSGDQAALAELEKAGTLSASVDISGATDDVVELVELPLPAGVSAINAPDGVTVTIGITPLPGTVRLHVAIRTKNVDAGLVVESISPDTVEVLVGGPQAELSDLTPEDVVVIADLGDLGAGRHTVSLSQPRVPSGFFVRSVNPTVVDVVLRERGGGG